MAIHQIFSSLIALTLIGNGLGFPTGTDIEAEALVLYAPREAIHLQKRIQEIIGYRRVRPDQAQIYKDAGDTLTPSDGRGGSQIGKGVYTSDEQGAWEGEPGDTDCVILADIDAFNKLDKAWIPRTNWERFGGASKADAYVQDTLKLDPTKTIRMSVIDKPGKETLQMMIPNELLSQNGGGLNLQVNCQDPNKKKKPNLPKHKVDYNSWTNVHGEKYEQGEIEVHQVKEPAEQFLKDSEAAVADAEAATSVKAAEAASTRAEAAVKGLQDIAQQVVEYTIKYDDWMTIDQNMDVFELYNKVRANLRSVALKADEKQVEEYKARFDEAVKRPASPNDVLTEAEKIGEEIRQVVAKVQQDLGASLELQSNRDNTPPLQSVWSLSLFDLGKLADLEEEAIKLEVSLLEKSLAKLAEIQRQVDAQLEKLRPNPEANPGEKDKEDKDKDQDKDKDKDKDKDNSNKEQDKNNGNKEKEQDKDGNTKEQGKADGEKVIKERTKVADEVATTSGNSWVKNALIGIGVTIVTLVGSGGLTIAASATGGAAAGGSFTVGGFTILSAPVALQVSDAEVMAVIEELLPEVTNEAMTVAAETLRPPTPIGNVQIPVLARKRAQGQDETPEVKRWRVAALAIIAQQAIRDSLEEAFKQAQQEVGNVVKAGGN